MAYFFTTLLNLLKSTGVVSNLPTSNLSTLLFKQLVFKKMLIHENLSHFLNLFLLHN